MSRSPAPAPIMVPPTSSVITALSAIGVVAVVLGLLVLFMRAQTLGVKFF